MWNDNASLSPEQIADALATDLYAVCADFASPEEVLGLRQALLAQQQAGAMQQAAIGRGEQQQVRPDVRNDKIVWWEPQKLQNPVEIALYERLQALRICLNRSLYLGINYTELHYAYYPIGGHYEAHYDAFKGVGRRKVSFVLYLNPDWQPQHEGELRLLFEGQAPIDIAPLAGTLACFLSTEVLHEVRPTKAPRYSLTGWMRHSDLQDMLLANA
ncbi:2OG-Fe(II) oxygenase [Eisenibacter elegans]|jgi:SM-20-related protein|uniref:2OG-Fe(II) oxygenase n=1 Tax=Eisenibacter elegans TaxID=997 RepID=UPI000404F1E5|nr:2OG-Fe(II) oxygenase [Eisenibacter elegans]